MIQDGRRAVKTTSTINVIQKTYSNHFYSNGRVGCSRWTTYKKMNAPNDGVRTINCNLHPFIRSFAHVESHLEEPLHHIYIYINRIVSVHLYVAYVASYDYRRIVVVVRYMERHADVAFCPCSGNPCKSERLSAMRNGVGFVGVRIRWVSSGKCWPIIIRMRNHRHW